MRWLEADFQLWSLCETKLAREATVIAFHMPDPGSSCGVLALPCPDATQDADGRMTTTLHHIAENRGVRNPRGNLFC